MTAPDRQTAHAIGLEGFVYLYPLVLMDVTRRQMTNVEHVGDAIGRGPADAFVHVRAFPPAEFRDVVRPNFDTLYSVAWLDLHEQPRIVTVPEAGEQYYLLPFYDMFGEVFTCPGTRTTGSGAGAFAILPPGWEGDLPDGVRVYRSPSRWAWIIGRTEASVETYEAVHGFQDGMTITPLPAWGKPAAAVTGTHDPSIDDRTPLRQVFAMDAATFFGTAADLLAEHGAHFQDYPILDRLARVGLHAGAPFDLGAADAVVREAFEQALPEAQRFVRERQREVGWRTNGWMMNTSGMGAYGVDYLKRAAVELAGLGANLPEDAIYPLAFVDDRGEQLTGAQRYVWHLERDELPPCDAFWSLTLYDDEGFQVANELNRFAIGDRDELAFGDDGSLELAIQHERPPNVANWLPAPAGGFNLCARLYLTRPEALDGSWKPPAVRRVS